MSQLEELCSRSLKSHHQTFMCRSTKDQQQKALTELRLRNSDPRGVSSKPFTGNAEESFSPNYTVCMLCGLE